MPVHDLGYRSWAGAVRGSASRIQSIAETGSRLALKSAWVKRILLFAWMPMLVFGGLLYFAEQTLQEPVSSLSNGEDVDVTQNDAIRMALARQLRITSENEELKKALLSDNPDETRRVVWRWLLMNYFRYPQAVAMVFLLGFVAPGLVSRDFRSRAFLLYFSRPIGRLEYVLGKLAIPAIFLAFISTIPALALYVTGLFLSPDLGVIAITWDVPVRILLATFVLVIPTASLSIALSSLTQESRFASFAWFAVWMLGLGAWGAVLISKAASAGQSPNDILNMEGMNGWSPLSLYMALGEVQNWVFGFDSLQNVWPCLLELIVLSALSTAIFWRRIGNSIQT